MTETSNVTIPLSLQRLHQEDLETLTLTALTKDITREDIQTVVDRRIAEKRAANSIVRICTDDDIKSFTDKMAPQRDVILLANVKSVQAFVARGIVTIRYTKKG